MLVSERHAACSLQTVLHWEQTWRLHDLDLGLALAVQCIQTREWLEFALRALSLSLSLRLALLVVFICGYVPEDTQKAMQSGVQKWGFTNMGASIFPPTFGSRGSPAVSQIIRAPF